MTIDATVANQYELSETAAALEAAGASASFLAQFTATSGYTVERVELAALRIDGALTLDPACGGERSMQRRHRAASLDAIEAELAPIPHRCELGPAPDAVSPGARAAAARRGGLGWLHACACGCHLARRDDVRWLRLRLSPLQDTGTMPSQL